ncbi:MAG TPA: ROK family protein [Candidatus Acidoferrales bacterium]|nr:ROK family protein [Candidatus Acidoferrales bacterium]
MGFLMAGSDSIYLGVDIGGTKVAAGLVDASGEILAKARAPMNPRGSAGEGFAAVRSAIDAALAMKPGVKLSGVGLCSPGPLDPRTGIVLNPPNLPCWRNYPLAKEVSKAYGVAARVDNDANAAGLAEYLWGAARGYRYVFYATLGTGIGTGIVFDGKIYHGRTGAAAEGGHITIDWHGPKCGCGKHGCIEVLASGPAIAARARAKIAAGDPRGAHLLKLVGGTEKIQAEQVAEAWRASDALATEVLAETADLLAIWLGNVIDVLEPEIIVIGGGVGELASHWFDRIKQKLPAWSINQRCTEIPIVLARYSADAGIAGAAALCVQ